jgi:hypothetical protein
MKAPEQIEPSRRARHLGLPPRGGVRQIKKIRGLHENDFIMAVKIDQLYDGMRLPS